MILFERFFFFNIDKPCHVCVMENQIIVKQIGTGLTLYHTILTFNEPPIRKSFENVVGKAENAGNQHFLLFPQYFQPSH